MPMPIPPNAGGGKNTQDLAVKTKFLTIKEKEEKKALQKSYAPWTEWVYDF